jgi:hypothetical protein
MPFSIITYVLDRGLTLSEALNYVIQLAKSTSHNIPGLRISSLIKHDRQLSKTQQFVFNIFNHFKSYTLERQFFFYTFPSILEESSGEKKVLSSNIIVRHSNKTFR